MNKLITLIVIIFSTLILVKPIAAKEKSTIRQTINSVFKKHADMARCVSWNESHWKPNAVSPWSDYGLFQINKATWDGQTIKLGNKAMRINFKWINRPKYNTKVAWFISRGGTYWNPWTAYNIGLC
jgi:membrane-bound lytic murein transglycosylase MltF